MRGIVPDAILDRRDKIGFATPEIEWLSSLAAQVRDWIGESEGIDFSAGQRECCRSSTRCWPGECRFTWQAWRWINFCRWHARVFEPMSHPQPEHHRNHEICSRCGVDEPINGRRPTDGRRSAGRGRAGSGLEHLVVPSLRSKSGLGTLAGLVALHPASRALLLRPRSPGAAGT